MKQAPFHALQREDRQVSGDDDGDGVEHRALHFVRSLADFSFAVLDSVLLTQMAHDVFDHYHRAVDHHPKIQRSKRQKVGGDMTQVQTDGGKQQ
jgi:hypothetical protein